MYKTLIIGAGNQGALSDAPGSGNEHKIISYAHALKEHEGFNLVGITDNEQDKADWARRQWKIKWWAYGEMAHELFLRKNALNDKIDVAVVATPDDTHYDILKDLLRYKKNETLLSRCSLRLVICEKPLCTDLQQAREIVALYKEKGIPLMVNYTRRFLPYYEDLKHRYEAGEFGGLLWASVMFNRGLLHTGSHAVDFLEWFAPGISHAQPQRVFMGMLPIAEYRIWQLEMFFEKYHWREERIGEQPVWPYYDQAMLHVVNNAYEYLEGREPLKCTGEDALRTLEVCYELMGNQDESR